MSRKRKLHSIEDFKRSIKNGYGLGEREKYKPWLRVQDVSSHGNSAKVWGIKTGREHHFLSELETSFFYLSEFCDSVVDIREQFPLLPLNLSESLASYLGIAHPKVPRSEISNVLTTDFLITRKSGDGKVYEAITVKPIDSLKNERTCEKLDLEKAWWDALGVKFHIHVDSELNNIRARNIEWATHPIRYGFNFGNINISDIAEEIKPGVVSVGELCDLTSDTFSLSAESSLYLIRYLVGSKIISMNLDCSVQDTGLLEILSVNFGAQRGEVHGAA